jgi:hypothetical protein
VPKIIAQTIANSSGFSANVQFTNLCHGVTVNDIGIVSGFVVVIVYEDFPRIRNALVLVSLLLKWVILYTLVSDALS